MARLKFFVFAVIAVAVAAFAVSAVSSSAVGAAQASAGDAARQAALAAAGEVATQQQALTEAALAARTHPEVAAVVEGAGFARAGLTAVERLERLRVPVFASLPEDLRATTRVWLIGETGTARATLDEPAVAVGAEMPAEGPAPEMVDGEEVEAAPQPPAPSEAVPASPGIFRLGDVPYLVTALELTPARGRLLIGAPLRLQPLDALVEGSSTLSLALMAEGEPLVSAGAIPAGELVSQVTGAPVGGSAPVLRGAAGAVGPLQLPLFAGPPEQTVQRVGSRHALTEDVEIGAIIDLSKVQSQLAEGQKTGLFSIGGLAILGLFWTLIMGGSRQPKGSERTEEGDSESGPLRASLSVLPLDAAAAPPKAAASTPIPAQQTDSPTPGPDDFQFPSEQPAPQAEAEEDDAAQALASGGGRMSPVPPSYQSLPPTPVPSAATSPVPSPWATPVPAASAPPVGSAKPLDPFGMVSQGSPADSYYGDDNPDATRVAAVPQELLQASASSMPANAGASAVARPLGGVPSVAAPAVDPEEQHFHDVFQEFVATRARCGEPSEGVTYDKFVAKLRKNRDQLVQKYACRTVRFQVYVKEGKAALKATPVKD